MKHTISEETVLRAPASVTEAASGVAVVIDPAAPNWIMTDERGARILRYLDGRTPLGEVVRALPRVIGTGPGARPARPGDPRRDFAGGCAWRRALLLHWRRTSRPRRRDRTGACRRRRAARPGRADEWHGLQRRTAARVGGAAGRPPPRADQPGWCIGSGQ